ncbi:hypothetical protein KM043_014896 [Ampulex compressa]|nr:hypothetical protein KM043_014896 [Ampulex compressa]
MTTRIGAFVVPRESSGNNGGCKKEIGKMGAGISSAWLLLRRESTRQGASSIYDFGGEERAAVANAQRAAAMAVRCQKLNKLNRLRPWYSREGSAIPARAPRIIAGFLPAPLYRINRELGFDEKSDHIPGSLCAALRWMLKYLKAVSLVSLSILGVYGVNHGISIVVRFLTRC